MCTQVICNKCNLLSFVGCGNHLDYIFNGFKASQLCKCNPKIVQWIKFKNLK
jgi:hypothetical protein